mgnify:FL=1
MILVNYRNGSSLAGAFSGKTMLLRGLLQVGYLILARVALRDILEGITEN